MLPPLAHAAASRIPPEVGGSNPIADTFSQACARSLNAPVLVTDIGDGALLVEPLRFHPVIRRHGRIVVRKSHHHGGLNG